MSFKNNIFFITFILVTSQYWFGLNTNHEIKTNTKKDNDTLGYIIPTTTDTKGLHFQEGFDMDLLLSKLPQVFVAMPAKAAGSTMKRFTSQCTGFRMFGKGVLHDNLLNTDERLKRILLQDIKPPSLIASHLNRGEVLQRLIKHSSTQSLVIYLHREETDRLLAAISTVVANRMCGEKKFNNNAANAATCAIKEGDLVQQIEARNLEIGQSGPRILTCEVYKAIEENQPNMVFVSYKQVGKLQKLLAKYHCPELLDKPAVHANARIDHKTVMITDINGNITQSIDLQEWSSAKRNVLELSLNLKKDVTCQGRTREMERMLFQSDNL
mmetsp:Transcript_8480/g.12328  ORF Transcript_8480/g.12328 Transcript_8480/m.12328 type:complete len:326 (-) Transcript_8480:332-1309(-)